MRTVPKFPRDFLLNADWQSDTAQLSGGAWNVINAILGFSRDIAVGVWTGPIPLLDLSET